MGRHSTAAHRRAREPGGPRRRSRLVLAAAIAVILAGGVAGIRLLPAASSGSTACPDGGHTIHVGADPAAQDWLSALARDYNAGRHAVNDRCVTVEVTRMDAERAVAAMQSTPYPGGGDPPTVWVPHSTTLLDMVRSRPDNAEVLPDSAPPVASSPLVLAAPPDAVRTLLAAHPAGGPAPTLAEVLQLAADGSGWAGLGQPDWGPVRFAVVNPSTSTTGTSLLIGVAAATTGLAPEKVTTQTFTRPETKAGLLRFVRSTSVQAASPDELLARARRMADTRQAVRDLGLLALTERDVWRYNRGGPAVRLEALYPFGGTLAADFPYVVPTGSWVTALDRAAAEDFRGWLGSARVRRDLASYGLRPADGAGLTAEGLGLDSDALRPAPAAGRGAPSTARASWQLLTQRVMTLAVMDVSGSMADPVEGTGRTRLQLAVEAALTALPYYGDADRTGLWEFSTDLPGDYRELVPPLPAGTTFGGTTVRAALDAAYRAMTPRNGTALYDTVLAAYDAGLRNYQRDFVNTVVVLTDGENQDEDSISLDTLLRELAKRQDRTRPVHIITIGYGDEADDGVLRRIAETTGGLHFASPDPRNIGEVFLTALTSLSR